jgi:uncharacterized protein
VAHWGRCLSFETNSLDLIDYAQLTQSALKTIMRQALLKASGPNGMPANHHFYISFVSRAKGVALPPEILAKYPDDMTIVLQHQYRDLKVFEDSFHVTLSFGGIPKVVKVPFDSILRFFDPSVGFELDFDVKLAEEGFAAEPEFQSETVQKSELKNSLTASLGDEDSTKVVSLEQFRKK